MKVNNYLHRIVINSPTRFIVNVGIILLPLYTFGSGGMQISHILIGAGMLLTFANNKLPNNSLNSLLLGYAFYALIREALSVISGTEIESLLPVLHALYAYFTFLVFTILLKDERLFKAIPLTLSISLALAVVGVIVIGFSFTASEDQVRSIGTFNNPNQLGYFAVLLVSIFTALLVIKEVSIKFYLIIFLLCGFLATVSLSKAAILSIIISPVALLFKQDKFSKATAVLIIAKMVVISLFALLFLYALNNEYFDNLLIYNRLLGMFDESDSDLSMRGYGLIFEGSIWQILFGFSSSGTASLRDGYEVHSMYMSPLVNYGIFGGGIFLAFFILLLQKLRNKYGVVYITAIFGPVLLYGITHNGGRVVLLWILCALCYCRALDNNLTPTNRLPRVT
jgi:hypothetical protein